MLCPARAHPSHKDFDKILDMSLSAPASATRGRRPRPPVAAFTAALVAGDAGMAGGIADAFWGSTRSRLAVISDLIHPAQYQIGELWYQGRLGVAEEHRATAIVTALGGRLAPTPVDRPVRSGACCILSGLTRERHVVGMQLLALGLEDEGWTVRQLVPPTPRAELLRAVSEWRPDVVGLSAAYLPADREIATAIHAVKALGVPVLVGGAFFNRAPDLWRAVGADAHGSDARVATVLMRKLLR
ncbi:MAG: cobalamin-dependent protein [Candidatus Dormibacteraeota bacterium]|nr:cobalamin-dependent protein [Candidatus Dormibacteraeota bacterium]